MRRAIVIVAALGAVLLTAPGAPARDTIACGTKLTWNRTAYKQAATHGEIPLGRRLGKGTIFSTCRTTRTAPPGTQVKRVVYAVDGVRTSVAIAIGGPKPHLYVSARPATADELRVLRRIRGG
jgi:hypothetical protein